jgi:hypothetical protein
MNSNWQTYKNLELIPSVDAVVGQPTLTARLGHIWRSLLGRLHKTPSTEPQIRSVCDYRGTWWYGYEPKTGQITYLESERDVDMWLEQQFRCHQG